MIEVDSATSELIKQIRWTVWQFYRLENQQELTDLEVQTLWRKLQARHRAAERRAEQSTRN